MKNVVIITTFCIILTTFFLHYSLLQSIRRVWTFTVSNNYNYCNLMIAQKLRKLKFHL